MSRENINNKQEGGKMTKAEYDKKLAELKEARKEAGKASREAFKARDKANQAFREAHKASREAFKARSKAYQVHREAYKASREADQAIDDLKESWAEQESEVGK